jgi:hypothetical protein
VWAHELGGAILDRENSTNAARQLTALLRDKRIQIGQYGCGAMGERFQPAANVDRQKQLSILPRISDALH